MKSCKICGFSELNSLHFTINHPHPPEFIGFICNFKASVRYVDLNKLKELLKTDKKQSKFVAVLVKPKAEEILEKIKDLPFDYYQLYDCSPQETKAIKEKYNKKIITALTIENKEDVEKYKNYKDLSDIILFDGKGYDQSIGFDHNLLNEVPDNINKMIAGDIKTKDLIKFKDKQYIIDISGHLESEKSVKDINKIDKFLNTVHNINS